MTIPTPAEFALEEKRKPNKCYTCMSPLRAQLEDAYANGVRPPTLARWMAVHHPDIALKEVAIRNHFLANHHVQHQP